MNLLKIEDLIEKEFIDNEELELIEGLENITTTFNGISGMYIGYNWYTVIKILEDGTEKEFQIYVK